jgi:hypothetical protein
MWCTSTHTSCTAPSLHAKTCTYSTSGPSIYNLYSIKKPKSQKNGRSIQTSTLWPSLTNTNDMLHSQQQTTPTMDSRALSLQTNDIGTLVWILWIQKKSRSDQNDLVATKDKLQQGLRCTRTHISCTVPSLHDRACTDSTDRSILYNKYSMKRLMSWKNRRSRKTTPLWVGQYAHKTRRIHNVKGHPLLTPGPCRSKKTASDNYQS